MRDCKESTWVASQIIGYIFRVSGPWSMIWWQQLHQKVKPKMNFKTSFLEISEPGCERLYLEAFLLSIDKMLSRRKRKNILGNEFKGYGSIRKTYQQHLVFTEFSHASSSFVQFYLSFPHRKQFYEIIPIYRWGKWGPGMVSMPWVRWLINGGI